MTDSGVFFLSSVTEQEIAREKLKAKDLRKTRWWQEKCARGICYYCGRKVGRENLTMDHVVPLVRGGTSVKNNLVPACKECNNKKKYLLPMEWQEYLNSI